MTKNNSHVLMSAAIAGILSVGSTLVVAHPAVAADMEKGNCIGANSCKGKSSCKTAENACKGQNSCKGKGHIETTEAKCDKMAKKNPKIHFEPMMAEEKKS
jgi:hypothetical protein